MAASPPVWTCRLHRGRYRLGCRRCHQPRADCRSWWSTVVCHPLDTTVGCRCHCQRCWDSGRTPLQRSAGTAGPGCTWCPVAPLEGAWWSLGCPGDSPLLLQRTTTPNETNNGGLYGWLLFLVVCTTTSAFTLLGPHIQRLAWNSY